MNDTMLQDPGRDRVDADEVVARAPGGSSPPRGWPVLVFLHGCGERAAMYTAHVALAAECGFVGLAPSGPVATRSAGRSWSGDLASTDDCVQSALAPSEAGHGWDRGRVYLCGFSQGATHAYGLLAARPDRYVGAIVLSPGEGPEPPPVPPVAQGPRPVYLSFGQGEYRAFRQRAQNWAGRWRRAGQPCLLEPHPGGHHLPEDWADRIPRVVSWLWSHPAAHVARLSPRGADAGPGSVLSTGDS
jgi:predicted esterase